MSSSSRTSKSLEKEDEREFMLRNGKILLEKLITSCNGKHNPIRTFTAEELKVATNNYDRRNIITKDLLYRVYKGMLEDRPISVMKFITNMDVEQYCFNCIVFATQMNHKNVLKFRGYCLGTQIPILVFEFVAYGTLANRIHDTQQSQFEPFLLKHRLKTAMEIASAVAYLHVGFSRPIVFRDIKPSTILFQEQYVAKFFDFSVSIIIPEGETCINDDDKVIGTFGFVAPEYLRTGYCNEKSDVYSFGALLLELLTGKRISYSTCFENGEEYYLQELVEKHAEKKKLNEVVDPVIVEEGLWLEKEPKLLVYTDIALKCLSKSVEERPTMVQVAKQLKQIYQSIQTLEL
ncbi:putative Receptor protein kinase [Melia azedarach]|uniref:Receptor protein kinase n=1 Tax=Melia azedarach TaxID=155640 RepID=A0ACC1YAH5_MELAZ|nr:putative Receptor protein kinase [Melia azedarach]